MSAAPPSRDDLIKSMCARNGKTPEQNQALLEILGSGLNRRAGKGATLDREQVGVRLRKFIGGTEGDE